MRAVRSVLAGVAAVAIAIMLAAYYANGLVLAFWPDSAGYLAQARGIAGETAFARPGDRSIGYPLLVAAALETPWPMLVLVLAQAALAGAAFASVAALLERWLLPRLDVGRKHECVARGAIRAGVALAALYSVVHVQIASLLTEILFAALALGAVAAATWLVLPGRRVRMPWIEAPMVAMIGALPVAVKPHWQFAAAVIAVASGGWLWRTAVGDGGTRLRRGLWLAGALAVTLAAMSAVTFPDKMLGARFSAREQALFGPRTAFCNHAHLVERTLQKRPGFTLQDDAHFEAVLRGRLGELIAERGSGWRLLGFNGDLCSYDAKLSELLERRFPDPKEQGRFLLGSVARASLRDPLPYAGKVLTQLAQGFLSAFARFAIVARPGVEAFHAAEQQMHLPVSYLAGVSLVGEVGPLGSKDRLDGTLAGRLLQGLLAVTFTLLTAALVALAAITLVLPWWRWKSWSAPTRETFAVFLALPLTLLFAHHLLIALVHTFDIWRYGFNTFFVNLAFIGASALFWLDDWRRWRGKIGT